MAQKAEILKLAAIVFTDIVGYSAIIHRDAGLGKRLLDRQRSIVRRQVGAYSGREIETAGDSFLLLFESTVTALSCIADIQRALQQANHDSPKNERVQIRAAVHLGDVERREDGAYGDGVNIAARILPYSPEGGVALSDIVNRQIKNRLSVPTNSIGAPALKNIEQPVEIFTLDAQALAAIESSPDAPAAIDAVHPALYTNRSGKPGERERSATLIWKFDNAEFDERALELTVGGEPVELERKPLEVLRHLLWHAGEVVTRDELLDAVWPGRILSESVISKCISRLREALKDEDQRIIKTAHGYGYRLLAEVQVEHPKSTPLPAPRFNFQPGDSPPLRPQWKLKERLGTGGHGEAWLAEHEKTREKRVYKFAFDDQALVALKREITLYRLLHDTLGERPDFVRIIDWNLEEAPCFTEAELADGGNLLTWAEHQGGIGKVPLATRIELAAQIAETLSAAHSVGVLHKDLKPSNVLIESRDASAPRIKLMDFGSGGVINPAKLDELGITRMGFTQVLGNEDTTSGTPLYLPPEVIAGHPTTVQGDIYALGIILYQLVIGDLKKPLAPGWELDVEDELLRQDIAETADGNPRRRLADSVLLAQRLRTLEQRRGQRARERQQKEQEQRTVQAAEATRHENEKLKARRTGLLVALAVLVLGLAASLKLYMDARTAKLEAVKEATEARALSDFLQWDLLTAINSGKQDTRQLTAAKALLDAGASKIGERLASLPVAQAKLRGSFSLAYGMLGFRDDAGNLERENVALTKRLLDAQSPEALEVGAETIAEHETLDEKDASYQFKLNDLAHAQWPLTDLRRIWVSYASVKALLARGDYARARQLSDELETGLKGADQHNDDYVYARRAAQYAIGELYAATGDFARMESLYRTQLDEFIQAAEPDRMIVGGERVRLAMILVQTGRLAEAEEMLTAGLMDLTAVVGADNANVVQAKIDIGLLRAMQGRYADAQAVADPAFALLQAQAVQDDFVLMLPVEEAMALQEVIEGRLNLAETHLRDVLALREKHDSPDSLDVAANRIELANVLREQGRIAEAREQMKLIPASTIVKLESAPPNRINLRRADGMLALAEGHRDQALTELKEALHLSQKIYSDRSFWTIRLRKELAAAQGGSPE